MTEHVCWATEREHLLRATVERQAAELQRWIDDATQARKNEAETALLLAEALPFVQQYKHPIVVADLVERMKKVIDE